MRRLIAMMARRCISPITPTSPPNTLRKNKIETSVCIACEVKLSNVHNGWTDYKLAQVTGSNLLF